MEAGSLVEVSRQGTEAEVCFGLSESKMLVDMQELSPEAPGYQPSPAHNTAPWHRSPGDHRPTFMCPRHEVKSLCFQRYAI